MSEDINVNAIADVLNNKVDLANGVNQGNVDYVVESKFPTASDQTWYRVYKSGWVEQGGYANMPSTDLTIVFPKTMADTNYAIQASPADSSNTINTIHGSSKTTTSVNMDMAGSNTGHFFWEVKGMSAQGGN